MGFLIHDKHHTITALTVRAFNHLLHLGRYFNLISGVKLNQHVSSHTLLRAPRFGQDFIGNISLIVY